MSSEAFKMSATTPVQKKPLTCYYWKTGKCKFQDDECRYMHEDTGKLAFNPKVRGKDETSSKIEPNSHHVEGSPTTPPATHVSIASVICAIRAHQDYDFIKTLLTVYLRSEAKEALAENPNSYSTLLAAINADKPELVKLLLEHGANPNATSINGIPILMNAINNPSIYASRIVKSLLALGADPDVIPSHLWEPPLFQHYKKPHNSPHPETSWCHEQHQALLKCHLNVSMKYYLFLASRINSLTPQQKSTVKQGLSAPIIGQNYAIKQVNNYLLIHQVCRRDAPLVITFIGPPGHGKRTFARSLGNFQEVSPYSGGNNILTTLNRSSKIKEDAEASKAEKTALDIIFIDGDKVDSAWLKALLNTVDNDTNRHSEANRVKRANTVYILSVTLNEEAVTRIYGSHGIPNEYINPMDAQLFDKLENEVEPELKNELVQIYGASIAGRMQHIVPFVPFTGFESAVLAHQFIIDALHRLESDYAFRHRFHGKRFREIVVQADDEVYEYLGAFDDCRFGARSIQQQVTAKVISPLVQKYLAKISEDGGKYEGLVRIEKWSREGEYDMTLGCRHKIEKIIVHVD
ncbi:hypothetical protein PRK78_002656 [Emydomyces testavorans]|uniref:C3H1-type domain-containing protein n=1 Tax=Emydomyces testavorans TaxID=2070801 RepID=A0AAF0IJW3_9EURO|nr:hypothetical protein PRK78_002656 [Emydomyces testavorans]